jgi:uncharacterized protein RhaS with RHS repeats
MQRTSRLVRWAAALLFLSLSQPFANSADPLVGTWELNIEKSRFDPGPAPRSQTRTYESDGKTVRMTSKSVNAQGQETTVEYTASNDGKDSPITGSPIADTVSVKQIDASTSEATLKKNGKIVSVSRRVISSDGKQMTVTTTGVNDKGQPIKSELVFDRR